MLLYSDWRQVGYLRLREVEPNAIINPGHGTDRDGDLFLAPQVPFVEENVGYLVVTGVDDEPTDMSNGTVGRVDVLTSAQLHFTYWDPVVLTTWYEAPGLALAHVVGASRSDVGHQQHRVPPHIAPLAVRCGNELGLFGGFERLELGPSTTQSHLLLRCRCDEVDRDQPADVMAVPALYDKVGDRALDGVDNHTHELPTRAVFTVDLGSDGVLRCSAHVRAPFRRRALEAALPGDHLPLAFLHSNPVARPSGEPGCGSATLE